ncbi:endonuclease-reverse transcriptase [Plakobranchus ocellatus]|uniref:Endonuclease-reverse transcriptase n=1 Tax=Plakobranchus ocellatus TaxID=259542 RepID=A0AAV3ZA17_9GAST|nr:endonuclease-reverse transcriptase [Plakobranchus ocellatus]
MVQARGEATMDMLFLICNKILQTGVWPKPWTPSLVITLPKKGNLKLCQNYCTISLISHLSKVMLKVILNRLKPEAENIIAEEQAGFRPGCSTIEQIFNVRILMEKIMTGALEDHCGTVSISGRPITNLRFADDVNGLAGNECELASLVEQLDKASSNFGMDISGEKTKIMTNCKEPSKKEIKVNGQILESVTKFKYLGSIISNDNTIL